MRANGIVKKESRKEAALTCGFRNIFLFGQLLPSHKVEQILIGGVYYDY